MSYKFFVMFLIATSVFSQNDYTDIIAPRLSFVSDKSKATDINEYVIISKDTLYSKYQIDYDLSFLNTASFPDRLFLNRYKFLVFQNTDENSEEIFYLKQWSEPIVVYLDKELSKSIRKAFEEFYSKLNHVKNLNISFTSNLNKANYYIKLTSEIVNENNQEDGFNKNNGEKAYAINTGATYSLLTDKNKKNFSGILTVNPEGKTDVVLLKQLKQLFFISLGQFCVGSTHDSRSLLSENYDNAAEVTDYDLKLLQTHYGIIYDQIVNRTTFDKLIKFSNQ